MAQGRIAHRLLVSPAMASAGVLLALVVVALVLGGCGGGSSDDSASTAADAASGSGAGDSGSAKGSNPAGAGSGVEAEGPAAGSAASRSVAGAQGSTEEGGRQGSGIAQPQGAPEPGITPQQRREATVASMTLASPSSQASNAGPQTLPATYTCDGKGTSPALSWQGVPQGTAELVVFAMNVQPVEGRLFFDWAVAGLSPELEEIEAGKLPKGAVVGRNGFGKTGYEICPEGGGETYIFTVFALPKKLSAAPGFDPSALRREVLGTSGNVGLLALSYTRS